MISRFRELFMITLVGQWIRKGFGFALVFTAVSASAWAFPRPAPEMDPGVATSAMALLAGGLAMIAGRRRNK
jgi:hypothetical protein